MKFCLDIQMIFMLRGGIKIFRHYQCFWKNPDFIRISKQIQHSEIKDILQVSLVLKAEFQLQHIVKEKAGSKQRPAFSLKP
jgi:hypothetical protein